MRLARDDVGMNPWIWTADLLIPLGYRHGAREFFGGRKALRDRWIVWRPGSGRRSFLLRLPPDSAGLGSA